MSSVVDQYSTLSVKSYCWAVLLLQCWAGEKSYYLWYHVNFFVNSVQEMSQLFNPSDYPNTSICYTQYGFNIGVQSTS